MPLKTNFILTCNLSTWDATSAGSIELPPPNYRVVEIHSIEDKAFYLLNEFCMQMGYPVKWAGQMLGFGAIAVLVLHQKNNGPTVSESVAGYSYLTGKPFRVGEVRGLFDPSPDGDYYFGDFVQHEHRGHGLQRLLIRQRLSISKQLGRQYAYAMTNNTIPRSVQNYKSVGFTISKLICVRQVLRFEITSIKSQEPGLKSGRLHIDGIQLPMGYGLRRISGLG